MNISRLAIAKLAHMKPRTVVIVGFWREICSGGHAVAFTLARGAPDLPPSSIVPSVTDPQYVLASRGIDFGSTPTVMTTGPEALSRFRAYVTSLSSVPAI